MRSIWVVFSKEFLDIVRDRRRFLLMILSMFVFLPMIFVVPYGYLFIRAARQSVEVLTIPVQGLDRAPALITYLAQQQQIKAIAADDVKALVKSRKYSVGLIIPEDYEEKIKNGNSVELVVVIDRRRTLNLTSARVMDALEEYGTELTKDRLKERNLPQEFFTPIAITQQNAATTTETAGSFMGLFIPGFIIAIALNAGMPIAVSAIAGEKKKLTLEPVLFTPVSRLQLVLAKLLAVLAGVLITLFSMGVSLLLAGAGVLAILARSLPLSRIVVPAMESTASASANPLLGGYQLEPLAIILFLLAPSLIILLGAAFQILVSTWARNDEEATTYLSPLGFLSTVIFMAPFFLDDFVPGLWHYSLPVFGTILSMRDLLSNKVEPASLTVMFATSALYALVMLALSVWMFHREEVVFRT